MVDITFNITVQGKAPESGALLDPREVDYLLETERHHIARHIHKRLDSYTCDVHGQPPRVVVTGTYDLDTEQLDVQYNIEACCNLMIMRSAALLGR